MTESPLAPRPRLPVIDVLRGVALVAMIVYHLSWDLAYHGFVGWNVAGDPAWRGFAIAIAASFLVLVGVGLVLASRGGLDPRRYLARLGKVAAAAALVSVATYVVFPDSWVFFGILHMIAVGSVLALPFLRAPVLLTLAAPLLIYYAPDFLRGPAFDHPLLWFTGLAERVPRPTTSNRCCRGRHRSSSA